MNRKNLQMLFGRMLLKAGRIMLILLLFVPLSSFHPKLFPFGIRKVVIDPGHGGHDPGCLGASSKEKDIALAISLKLGAQIKENFPDLEVIYTRDKDVFVELHERARIANDHHADVFICIHCNSGPPTAYGSETYVMGLHRTKENLSVAKRENAAVLMEDDYQKNYDGFDPNSEEGNIIFTLYQSAFLDHSLNLASKIQDGFRMDVKRHDRGVKQAGFLVLYRTSMPSVLIETGFLTNKSEEDFLRDKPGQDKIAKAIFDAFAKYKKEVDGKTGHTVPREEGTGNKPGEKVVTNTASGKETGIVFRVQFLSSPVKISSDPANFKGLKDVHEYESGGTFKYTWGEAESMDAASEAQTKVRSLGYTDAFVVAFRNGQRIPVGEALKELNK